MAPSWNEFSSSATVHGFRFLNKESSLIRRIIWGILVLISTGFLLWQCNETFGDFFKFNVNTVVHLTNDGRTKFPAITICNTNGLRMSKLHTLQNDSRVQRFMQLSKSFMLGIRSNINDTTNSSKLDLSGEEIRQVYFALGHNMEKTDKGGMLEFCNTPSYGLCNSTDFKRSLTYTGSCFTLNSDSKRYRGIYTAASGRLSAIRVLLSIQVDEYTLSLSNSQSVGVNVLIHDQSSPALADTHGILIGPGVHTSIALKKTKIKSMKYPYETRCRDKYLSPGVPYSRSGCLRMCEEIFVIKKCKCKMLVDTILERPDLPTCSVEQTFKCAIPATTEQFPAQINECNCPFACESVEYTTKISKAPYPTKPRGRQQAIIDLTKMNKNITEENIQKRLEFYSKNHIFLEIFYDQLDYLTMKQIPATTTVGLVAAIGGLLGITLGASLLTVIETIDFVVFWILNKLSVDKIKRRKVTVAKSDNI